MQPAPSENQIHEHFPLVTYAIKRFQGQLDWDDLFQLGCLGLLKAIRYFDANKGFRFSSYAVASIRGEVLLHLRDNRPIKASRRVVELSNQIKRRNIESVESVMDQLECTLKDARQAFQFSKVVLHSMDYEYDDGDGDGRLKLQDSIASMDDQTEVDVKEFIHSLSPRDRRILGLRFLGKTQPEIAVIIGKSQPQVGRYLKRIGNAYIQTG